MPAITTARQIDAIRPTDKQIVESLGDGLVVKITPKNARSLWVRYRPAGTANPVDVKICDFEPELADRMTLPQARDEARRVRANNILPEGRLKKIEAGKAAREAHRTGTGLWGDSLVEAVCLRYLADRRTEGLEAKSFENIELGLARFREVFGARFIREIDNPELNQLLLDIKTRAGNRTNKNGKVLGGPAAMNNARTQLVQFFRWARLIIGKKIIQVDLTDFIKATARNIRPLRMEERHVRALHAAMSDGRLTRAMGLIARLQILTGLRAGEAAELRASEVQGDELVIAADRMKMGKEHRLPITPAIRQVLDAARALGGDGSVFGVTAGGYKNALIGLGLDFSSHDLRKFMRTSLDRLGVSFAVAEELLAHEVNKGVAAHYTFHKQSLALKAEALNLWANDLDRIIGGANVERLRQVA